LRLHDVVAKTRDRIFAAPGSAHNHSLAVDKPYQSVPRRIKVERSAVILVAVGRWFGGHAVLTIADPFGEETTDQSFVPFARLTAAELSKP
jgi:hypothetical protein